MKTTALIIPLVLAGSVFAFAQESPSPTPSSPEWRAKGGAWKSLTPEEREKLKAAHRAVKNDPNVLQARKTFQETQQAAMLKVDPTLAPVLEKLKAAKEQKGNRP
ncbi:MAG: hypothetical protein NTZ46_06440 [Verrucomicrobia bacterium]|nr:hypothetical protein [Verrucomicrobiota bacterium]